MYLTIGLVLAILAYIFMNLVLFTKRFNKWVDKEVEALSAKELANSEEIEFLGFVLFVFILPIVISMFMIFIWPIIIFFIFGGMLYYKYTKD